MIATVITDAKGMTSAEWRVRNLWVHLGHLYPMGPTDDHFFEDNGWFTMKLHLMADEFKFLKTPTGRGSRVL